MIIDKIIKAIIIDLGGDISLHSRGGGFLFTRNELEILSTLWRERRNLTKDEILELTPNRSWKAGSTYHLLASLMEKNAIEVDESIKTGKWNYSRTYKAVISQEDYMAYHLNDLAPELNYAGVISALVGKGQVSKETIHKLRLLLDDLDKDKTGENE